MIYAATEHAPCFTNGRVHRSTDISQQTHPDLYAAVR